MKIKNLKYNISSAFLFGGLFLSVFPNGHIVMYGLGLGLIILFMFFQRITIRKKALVESFLFLALLAISLLRFEFFLTTKVPPLQADAVIGNTAKYLLLIILWCCFRSVTLSNKVAFIKRQVIYILKINVAYFYFQFILMLVTGIYLDIGKYISGQESRYRGIITAGHGLGSFRATGFFAEPSNYFFVVLALLSLILLFFDAKNYRYLFIFTIMSMFLTFSTAAIIVGTLFLVYFLYTQKVSKKIYITLGLIILSLSLYLAPQLNAIYNSQVTRSKGGAGNLRKELVQNVLKRDENILTNFGLFAVDGKLLKLTKHIGGGERKMASINDSGLFIFMWAQLGFLGCVYFIVMAFIQKKRGWKNLILFLILSLTKIDLFTPILIIYFSSSMISWTNVKKTKNFKTRHLNQRINR